MAMWIQIVFYVVWAQVAASLSFSSGTDITTSALEAQTVFAADLDGDGDLDVLSASWKDSSIRWYKNEDGLGQFSGGTIISSDMPGAGHVFAADLDDDGDMDVLATSFFGDKVVWYENEGGEFSVGVVITSTLLVEPYALYVEDLDNDGDMDVLTGSYATGLVVWFENVNGIFATGNTISLEAGGLWSVFAADIDGDGDMDVISAARLDGSVRWFENVDGFGNFSSGTVITSDAPEVYCVYAADLDGDGDLDVLSAIREDSTIQWYENVDGNGTFSSGTDITTGALGANSVYASDLDGDGDMDVLSTSHSADIVRWYENFGNNIFSSGETISSEAKGPTYVIVADLDGDGDMDVLSSSDIDNRVTWYENNPSSSSSSSGSGSLSLGVTIGLVVAVIVVVIFLVICVCRRRRRPSTQKVPQGQAPLSTGDPHTSERSTNRTGKDQLGLGKTDALYAHLYGNEDRAGMAFAAASGGAASAVVLESVQVNGGVSNVNEIGRRSEVAKSIASAALEFASGTTFPLLKETATLIAVMATMIIDYKENEREMTKSLRWCGVMLKMLEEVNSQETLSVVVMGLLEDAHSSIEDLVKVVRCFLAKGTIGRMLSSTLFKRRQAETEEILRDALQRLQTGVGLEALNVAKKTSAAVDNLVQSQDAQHKAANRRRKRAAMLQQHEVPEDQVTFFPDVAKLGRGGFGRVELVEYNGIMTAAKVMDLSDLDDDVSATKRLKATFAKELHAMVLLRSDYTVNVYGAITKSPGRLVLLMEFMEGGDLRTLLGKDSALLEASFCRSLTLDIALGMEYLHSKKMIHGDLKSANILLNSNNQAKIADFGTAQTAGEYTTLGTQQRPGLTLKWSAPEVLNQEGMRLESDVYSFGILVWEIVTRKLPWAELVRPMDVVLEICRGRRPDVPADSPGILGQLMKLCWASSPADRPAFSKIVTLLQDDMSEP